jgi:RNase adaptor protein for sRNA GlmZ degradation
MSEILHVHIYSFSYLYSGIPEDPSGHGGGFVFDCRCLPNPGRFAEYADLTGQDTRVSTYLRKQSEVTAFLSSVKDIVDMAVRNYREREFFSLMVSFGCTGGQHRSVYCAEQLASYLSERSVQVHVCHTMLER